MKVGRKAAILIVLIVAAASAVAVLSKSHGGSKAADKEQQVESKSTDFGSPSGQMQPGPHMRMSVRRQPMPGDNERAESVARRARAAIEKYRDYRVALRDGYTILQPDVPQKMYHFNNTRYYLEAERQFTPEHPTSLLYEKSADGYRLIGVMYTAPSTATEEELDERIPLSVAAWHQHIDICLPEGDPLQNLFGQDKRFGLDGSITTRAECEREGGRFFPQLFGWMVHLYPYERGSQQMWSVERQMDAGSGHMH